MLIVHQYGHTQFLNPDACASHYETDYFLTGRFPGWARSASRTCGRSRPRSQQRICSGRRRPLL